MKKSDIRIGMKYKIVGNKGGCCGTKCINCGFGKGIVVTKICKSHEDNRCIEGCTLGDKGDTCSFLADDLEMITINWQDEF